LPVTVTGEQRLKMFGKKMLTGIFGPKRKEIKTEWRKLHCQ